MDFGITVKCPYCGFEETHTVEGRGGSEVVICDRYEENDGACRKEFVLKWKPVVQHTAHKIEDAEETSDTTKQAAPNGDLR